MGAPAVAAGLALRGAVGAAVAHLGPAVVAAGLDAVEFVAALRAVLVHPQLRSARAQRRALGVAVAVGPDLRAGLAHPGVARRDAAVAVEADDLAQGAVEVLRRVELLTLAERDVHRLVGPEHDAGAVMAVAGGLRDLAVDDLDALEAVAHEPPTGDGGPCATLLRTAAGLGVGPVDPGLAREVGVDGDIEQTALVAEHHRRHGERGEGAFAGGVEQQQGARLLGDEHPAIGQEREAPGALEAVVEHDRARRDGRDGRGCGLGGERRDSRRQPHHPGEEERDRAHGDSGFRVRSRRPRPVWRSPRSART